jgi:hypothetical protein
MCIMMQEILRRYDQYFLVFAPSFSFIQSCIVKQPTIRGYIATVNNELHQTFTASSFWLIIRVISIMRLYDYAKPYRLKLRVSGNLSYAMKAPIQQRVGERPPCLRWWDCKHLQRFTVSCLEVHVPLGFWKTVVNISGQYEWRAMIHDVCHSVAGLASTTIQSVQRLQQVSIDARH